MKLSSSKICFWVKLLVNFNLLFISFKTFWTLNISLFLELISFQFKYDFTAIFHCKFKIAYGFKSIIFRINMYHCMCCFRIIIHETFKLRFFYIVLSQTFTIVIISLSLWLSIICSKTLSSLLYRFFGFVCFTNAHLFHLKSFIVEKFKLSSN